MYIYYCVGMPGYADFLSKKKGATKFTVFFLDDFLVVFSKGEKGGALQTKNALTSTTTAVPIFETQIEGKYIEVK